VALQKELDDAKTQKERNRLGQFATPTLLASDVLAYARTLLPEHVSVRFLDPAIGTGSFYTALLRHFPSERVKAAAGIEIDPHYGKPARKLWRGQALKIELGDFTAMKPPKPPKLFNLIVCNPPYVRHHHMGVEEKGRLQEATAAACGVRMAGQSSATCSTRWSCCAFIGSTQTICNSAMRSYPRRWSFFEGSGQTQTTR